MSGIPSDETLIPLGARVKHGGSYWLVTAVGMTGGERFYWLTDASGTVAMAPDGTVQHVSNDEGTS